MFNYSHACFECKKEISDKAVACPNCGVPIPIEKRNEFALFIGGIFGNLFGTVLAICRKCRSPIHHGNNFCKTCGTYFPFHHRNVFIFICLFISLFLWLFGDFFR
ncbi:MAG: hypothetical protein HOF21_05670 [Nitrospina sp.]|nr:hypothetical protein [Nitrospina sp.]MBT5632095.1 hypothetical protein [Nitrospina sp.]